MWRLTFLLCNLERLPEGRYTKLSELLRDMPSDEELERLAGQIVEQTETLLKE